MLTDNAPNSGLETSEDTQKTKRRRLKGACDACRTKKTKCDSSERPGNICTNCILSSTECTHDIPRQQKVTDIKQAATAHIMILEARIKKLEDYIRRMHPGEDIEHIINAPIRDESRSPSVSSGNEATPASFGFSGLRYPSPPTDLMTPASTPEDDPVVSEADDLAHVALSEDLKKLSTTATDDRFFGQASTFMFAKHVTDVRNGITGESNAGLDPRKYRRLIYWELRPWEMSYVTSSERPYIYPDNDLMKSLVSLYFEKTNSLIPILHRPTFEKSLSLGQHHWDPSFGMTVLMVCALGSRYSPDPRVNVINDSSGLSAGWHYFCQVPVHRKKMLYKTSVHDLQYYCLATLYLAGTSMPHVSWTLLAIGLRHAFEKGAHRRKGNRPPSAEDELQKRAFWALVCLDNIGSSFVGRPCSIPHESYDVEYPIECDDEFWETDDPDMSFRQPPGKPSSITAFVHFIKLCEILGFVLRTLYTNKKSRILSGFIGPEWEERMVAELDSSMNKWKDSLPDHLHWDSERQDANFFHQSVNLHTSYYYIQIQIHRPYLTKKSELTLPSLAMCNNAARTCSRILEASTTRGARVLPHAMTVAYTAGMVITLSMWAGQSMGYVGDPKEDTENLQKCLDYLHKCEKKWHCAGRLGASDILREASDIQVYKSTANKRRRPEPARTAHTYQPLQVSTSEPSEVTATSISSDSINGEASGSSSMDDCHLRRLLLTEMGYLPEDPVESNTSNSMFNATDFSLYSLQPEATAPIGAPEQSFIPSPQGNDLFAVWSDNSMEFTSLEQWDTYLTYMSQS